VGAIKPGDQGLGEVVVEENSLCYIVRQQERPPFVAKTASILVFYHGEAFFLHPFVNNPG
jgi:hypothetical protein